MQSVPDIDQYRAQGFWVAKGIVDHQWLDAILLDAQVIFNAQARRLGVREAPSAGIHDLSRLLADVFAADVSAFRAGARLIQWSVALHRVSLRECFLELVTALGVEAPVILARPVLHIMGTTLKIPGSYHTTPPHQDWRVQQGSLDAISIWVPLADINTDHYPLEVVPGSHRRGLLESKDHRFGHRLVEGQIADDQFKAIKMDKGDAFFFNAFTVHRTGAGSSDQHVRFSASFRFNNILEPTFIERVYPHPYISQPDMALITPGFPTPEQVEQSLRVSAPV